MKRWGLSPWENQAAASWVANINESKNSVTGVCDALHLDVSEYAEEVRAAAALLLMLIETGRWPVGKVEAGLELAISRLQEICDKNLFDGDPGLGLAIREEIRVLLARLLNGTNRASASG